MTEHVSRRDFIKTSFLVGLSGLLSACGMSREQLADEQTQWRAESDKYIPARFEFDQVATHTDSFIEQVGQNRPPDSARVIAVPDSGTLFTQVFTELGEPTTQYKRFPTVGLMSFPGDVPYRQPEAWNNLEMEGTELLHIWEYDVEPPTLLPTLENAKKAGVRLMPDIKYALMSKRLTTDSDGVAGEMYFDARKLKRLIKEYPGVVAGFTLDAPHKDALFLDGGKYYHIDYEKFVEDYAKECGLPLVICEWGMLSAKFEREHLRDTAPMHEYVLGLYRQILEHKILVVGGSFNYPGVYDDATAEEIVDQLVLEAKKQVAVGYDGPKQTTLPAHDTGSDPSDFENMQKFGEGLPSLAEEQVDGFVRATNLQAILFLAEDKGTSGIKWWNFNLDEDPQIRVPFSRSLPAIKEAIKSWGDGVHAIDGKVLAHTSNDEVAYTRKNVVNGDGSAGTGEAVFVHVKRDGQMPLLSNLRENTIYKDTITGLVFNADMVGQIITSKHIPKNTVFCLVPAVAT